MTKAEWYQKNKERVLAQQAERWKDPKVRARRYAWFIQRRKKLKLELVNHAGGKCADCGYCRCPAALEFHHRTGTKEFRVSQATSRKKAFQEVKKCVLLCANCHRERHNCFGLN
jgi:hypothetical protein